MVKITKMVIVLPIGRKITGAHPFDIWNKKERGRCLNGEPG